MTQEAENGKDAPARCIGAGAGAPLVFVCEHASNHIPEKYANLGLDETVRASHVAWDPGASAVARRLAEALDAPLVEAGVSRLVYDCNRPPEAADAMPAKSEIHEIPGNRALSDAARAARVAEIYAPFRRLLAETIAARPAPPALITIHSFTPIYHGRPRGVEIGILHDADSRLADAMLESAPAHTTHDVRRNAPYGPADGVTHTLREHALSAGLPNVMIEIRNDLIAAEAEQEAMAKMLAPWIAAALAQIGHPPGNPPPGRESGGEITGEIPRGATGETTGRAAGETAGKAAGKTTGKTTGAAAGKTAEKREAPCRG